MYADAARIPIPHRRNGGSVCGRPNAYPQGYFYLPKTFRKASAWVFVSLLSIVCSAVIGLP
jgi:hypothetical protein